LTAQDKLRRKNLRFVTALREERGTDIHALKAGLVQSFPEFNLEL
jgi:hypothetical protein